MAQSLKAALIRLARWVAIAGALIAAGIAVAALGLSFTESDLPRRLPGVRWFLLVAFTALTFGHTAKEFQPAWRRASFWMVLTGLLSVHLVLFLLALVAIPDWKPWGFLFVSIVEGVLLFQILHSLGYCCRAPSERT